MKDAKGFKMDLNKFAISLGVDLGLVMTKAAVDIFSGVVSKTPVRTGTARASWQIAVNRIPKGVTIISSKDTASKKKALASAVAMATAGKSLGLSVALKKIKPTDVIWIANNLPYIQQLENGSSQQAPSGMVAVTLQEVSSKMRA